MYVDAISEYFTRCVWHQLYDTDRTKYVNAIYYMKTAFTHQSKLRLQIYENIAIFLNTGLNSSAFVSKSIEEFFDKYIISDQKQIYTLFDSIMQSAVIQYLEYIQMCRINDIMNRKFVPYFQICKSKLSHIIALEINKFSILLVSNNDTDKHIQKLQELNNHLKSELKEFTDIDKRNVSTQTD